MFLHNCLSFTRRNIHSATHKSHVFRYYRFIIITYQCLLIVISLHIIIILSLHSAAPFGIMGHHSLSSTFNVMLALRFTLTAGNALKHFAATEPDAFLCGWRRPKTELKDSEY